MLRGKRGSLRNCETGAAHPALPAVILLVSFAVFMAALAPLDFSSIFHKLFPTHGQKVPHQNAAVWVNKSAGVYYCADSIMFGKTQGAYMKQVEALDRGYQPALGTYCSGPGWPLHGQFKKLNSPHASSAPNKASVPESTFRNPNYRPQGHATAGTGAGSTQQFIPD